MQNIDIKLEFWKNRLLDLGKRNRLINCPLPKDGKRVQRHSLQISSPSSKIIWELMAEIDGTLSFPVPLNDSEHEQESEIELTSLVSGIQTNQTPNETHKTLRSLMKKAKEFTEEKGLNALHLAFGFLNWIDNGAEGQEMRSPLLLVPVKLTQEDLFSPIILSRSDEEISANYSLEQKLLSDFGIELPTFAEEIALSNYLDDVAQAVKNLGWSISNDTTQLSLFSFMKINMYRDLERNANKICEHHIVRALNGEVLRDGAFVSNISEYDHDEAEPQDVFSVVDADSSQQDAILLAKRGESFVLQGPPGTGKSQTITNIIAELIADGKKVLFVSEKMAALEVVYKRLTQAGLDQFCLTLHSHKAKRREILEQCGRSMQLSRQKTSLQQDAYNRLFRLKEIRNALNEYAAEVHTVIEPLGKTIYQVSGYLSRYENLRNVDFVQPNAEDFTPLLLSQCKSALEEVTRIVSKSGYQQNNPWNGCVHTEPPTHEFRQRFLVDTEILASEINDGLNILADTNEILGTNIGWSIANINEIQRIYNCVLASPVAPPAWISLDLDVVSDNLDSCVRAVDLKNIAMAVLESFNIDCIEIRSSLQNNKMVPQLNTPVITNIDAYNNAFKSKINLAVSKECCDAECTAIRSSVENNMAITQESVYILEDINTYNEVFEHQKLIELQKEKCLEKIKISTEKRDKCQELSIVETKRCDDLLSTWQSSQEVLLRDYDEKILSLDVSNLLSRYRIEYRSFFKRLWSNYKQDRKTILECCRKSIKLNHEQGLYILDAANDVLTKRAIYEQQSEIVRNADASLRTSEAELSEITANLNEVVTSLADVNAQLLSEKQNLLMVISDRQNKATISLSDADTLLLAEKQKLITAINNTDTDYKKALSENEKNLCKACSDLGRILVKKISSETDFVELRSMLSWCVSFKALAIHYSLSQSFINDACEGIVELHDKIDKNIRTLNEWLAIIIPKKEKFMSLFDDSVKQTLCSSSLTQLSDMIKNCKDNFASLEYLIDYRKAEKQLNELGINSYLATAKEIGLDANEIVPVFKKCFFRSWLDVIIPRYSSIQDFRRLRQDERIAMFKNLDKSHLDIAKAIVKSKLITRLPNFDAYSANGEIAVLRREMAKQRKLMPTRLLIARLPNLLPALKPCMMMSPLSVSTYLGNSNFEFDTVIFDEASQVRTEDAVGAIFRAKQAIIAGDSKQLPPSDFFTSSMSISDEYDEDDDGEINDAGAYESLLDEATMLPTQTLLWHYRSRHEHLIAFSNAKIYQGNLTTFPSSVEKADGMGVEYVHVQGGTYDRRGKNGNQAEATRVADLVFEHFRLYPNRSLGIIAFGEVQQSAIQDALIEKRRANLIFEEFFKEDNEEYLFIKNLETVQGDERDTIIFSIGYAPDLTGKFTMNFGPLSRNGGERRLNVAVTRARYNLKLVGSILPTDINLERVGGQGPKLLRLYIDFAINGAKAILGEVSADSDGWFDSPFEESVHEFLTTNGFDVAKQVGCSGYRIDMAVRHPKYAGRFAIGIECDGAMYHSARTARERDRLRQTVLEDMGWNIYRVWSTDWIKDRHTEGIRLLKAVNNAINDYRETAPNLSSLSVTSSDFLDVSTQTVHERKREGVQQKSSTIRSRYYGCQAKDIPSKDMEETMRKVLKNDFGLDKAGLFKETALHGYGWERQGSNIKDKFELALRSLLQQGIINEDVGGKLQVK